jgi:hypothetical protein
MEIVDAPHAGSARRVAVECATSIGVNETDRARSRSPRRRLRPISLSTPNTEGFFCQSVVQGGSLGLRVMAVDNGHTIDRLPCTMVTRRMVRTETDGAPSEDYQRGSICISSPAWAPVWLQSFCRMRFDCQDQARRHSGHFPPLSPYAKPSVAKQRRARRGQRDFFRGDRYLGGIRFVVK